MNKEIEIPEGYEARIEGNKVIIELKESEDERIRNYIQNELACLRAPESKGSERYNKLSSAIAYIEKQKECKPLSLDLSVEDVETIKTALREAGLKSTANQKVYDKLEKIPASAYYLSTVGRSELYPDGRVECHIIGYFERQKEQKSKVKCDTQPVEQDGTAEPDYGICDDYIPATLHTAMARHGWYAGHIKEDEKFVLKRKEYVAHNWPENKDNLIQEKPVKSPEDIHNHGYIKGVEDAYNNINEARVILKRLVKENPKPAEWSEEDEKMLASFLHKVEVCDLLTNKESAWIVERLKALHPQPKQEWSEEDTEMYINVASSLRGYACGLENEEHKKHIKKGLDWFENRFKSLQPQPHWKPSEVQMEALAWYSGNSGVPPTGDKAIKSLYTDLQKLL